MLRRAEQLGNGVTAEWQVFSDFYAWAKGTRIAGGVIELIDPARPYGPDNVRWATRAEILARNAGREE